MGLVSVCFCFGAPIYVAKGPPKRGEGGGLHFRAFPSWFLHFCAFVLRMWVYARVSGARSHLKTRRGHTHGGKHDPISSSFSWLSSCPAPKSAHHKIQNSFKIFIHDPVLYAKDKTRRRCIYDSLFSPISYGFKAVGVLFCLYFYFFVSINLHAK